MLLAFPIHVTCERGAGRAVILAGLGEFAVIAGHRLKEDFFQF